MLAPPDQVAEAFGVAFESSYCYAVLICDVKAVVVWVPRNAEAVYVVLAYTWFVSVWVLKHFVSWCGNRFSHKLWSPLVICAC